MTQVSSSTVWGVAERIVVAPVGRVRSEIVRLLGQRSFTLTTDQLTVIEGQRGSALAGAGRTAAKVPVQVRARLTAGDPGCAVWMEIRDGWRLPMARPVSVYQDIIGEVLQSLDDALRRLDPEAEAFQPPQRSWHSAVPDTGHFDDGGGAVARMSQAANRYLDHDSGDAPKGWTDRGLVSVVTPRGIADLRIDTLYGMVTAGTLVAARPGPMPSRLVSQVEQTVGMFERLLENAGGWAGNWWIELDDKAVPVVEFLVQQAKIREAVPLRTLQVCVTCRLAKVVNPDYARLRSRSNKLRTLQSGIGAVISPQGISPFVLIGKLAQLNQLDPDFVCPRCQGLHAENSVITFCPHCGDQRDESALRECAKCKYDFRALAKTTNLWREPEPILDHTPVPGQFGHAWAGDPGAYPDPGANPVLAFPAAPGIAYPDPAATVAGPVGGYPAPTPFPDLSAYESAQPNAGYSPAAVDAPYPGGGYSPEPVAYAVPLYQHGSAESPFSVGAEPAVPYVAPASQDYAAAPAGSGYPTGSGQPTATDHAAPPVETAALAVPAEPPHLLPAWYPDPSGRHEFRWWDGQGWAEFVLDQDQSTVDPL